MMTHPSLTGLSLKLTPENLKKGDSKPHETECSLPVMTLTLLDTHLIKLPSINGNNICRQEKKPQNLLFRYLNSINATMFFVESNSVTIL